MNRCNVCGWLEYHGPHRHDLVPIETIIHNEKGQAIGIRLTFEEKEPRLPFESG